MLIRRAGRLLVSLVLLGAMGLPAMAQGLPDYQDAQFVTVTLGTVDEEQGIRRVDNQPDGQTAVAPKGGRRSLATAAGGERYFYFDVHDSYINGGFNPVVMTVRYEDVGKGAIFLEYDAYDVVNPKNMAPEWVKKRVTVAQRTDSGAVNTAFVVLEDARFGNNQPGGADFRLVTTDELILRSVSVMRSTERAAELPIRVVLDGQEVLFPDVPPMIENGSTLVPMRLLFNALGVPNSDIDWNGTTGTVIAKKGQTMVKLQVNSQVAWVDGKAVALNQPAIVRNGRTLIPLRFVSENLGLKVEWNPETRVITISTPSYQP